MGREKMAMIKFEVSVPEIAKTLMAFRNDRLKALEAFTQEVRSSASKALNELLQAELTVFLGQPGQEDNKRNGYKVRNYAVKGLGTLSIRLPQDRKGNYHSSIVPANEQIDPRLKQDMAVLYMAGISSRTLAMIGHRLLGLEVSHSTVINSLQLLQSGAERWLSRPLEGKYWALYIDGTNFNIQRNGTFEREPSLVVVAIDDKNRRSILAIEPGNKDSAPAWREVFKSLKNRGLDASQIRLGIMDGLPGLEEAFKEAFANAKTARCWIHAKRNIMVKCPARYEAAFDSQINRIMKAASEDDARKAYKQLQNDFAETAEKAVKCLSKDIESLLVHYSFEKKHWLALKTTNPIERVNKEFKRRSKSMEHAGEKTLNSLLVFTAMKLELGWRNRPIHLDSQFEVMNLAKQKNKNVLETVFEEMIH